jgi:Ca2+-binding EF-hand superfamily protein
MTKTLLGAGLLLAATAASAQLAPNAPIAPRDGVQTRAEVVERARAMFARVDANRDGYITREEGPAVRGQMRASVGERRGQRMAEGRGAGRAQMFDRIDQNRDNVISRDEWARAEAMRGERRTEGRRGGLRGERMAMRGRVGGAMLRMADTNRDERISLAEAQAAAVQRFDRVDLNRDGRVTRDERQQARQQRQAQRPAAAVR